MRMMSIMSDAKDLLRYTLLNFYPQLIIYLVVLIIIIFLRVRNPVTLTLAVLVPVLTGKLLTARTKPRIAAWTKITLITAGWVTGFYYLNKLLGPWGIIGFILIVLMLCLLIIIKNWKLLRYTMTWGADRLHGSKKRFNIKQVMR